VSGRILVSVGTDHHPFDRVVGWADAWARDHPEDVVVVQHGSAREPVVAEGTPLLDHASLQREMDEADVVVCHGGPATLTEARRHGHLPICVPRDPLLGEHVDDHQQRFARHLARVGMVVIADDEATFRNCLTRALAEPEQWRVPVAGTEGGEAAPGVTRIGELIDELVHKHRGAQPLPSSDPGPRTDRPVTVLYLGGQGRSGSTLLERAVGQLPGVVNVGELVHLWERGVRDDERCGCGEAFSRCEFWRKVGERGFGGWDRLDIDAVIRLRYQVDRNRYAPLLARPGVSPRYHLRQRRFADLLGRLYTAIADVSGAEVVVDSSKHGSYAWLLRQVPGVDLRVLHVVRDSRAVAFAWAKESVERPEAPGSFMPVYGPWRSSTYWNAQNALLEALPGPSRVVRYEDFVADPVVSLRRAAELLDHDPAEADSLVDGHRMHLATAHTVAGNPMRFTTGDVTIRNDDAWQSAMPVGRQRLVTTLTTPLRQRYGYR
jgi:UDP-N-acetylglucosamine transferase subunit ALG13